MTPWDKLGISRATWYRRKKASLGASHSDIDSLLNSWDTWRSSGFHKKPWSSSYSHECLTIARQFLESYDRQVSASTVRAFIDELPRIKYSMRCWRHRATSGLALFMSKELGVVTEEEYNNIKQLCPRKPLDYEPKRTIISSEVLREAERLANDEELWALIMLSETALRRKELAELTMDNCSFSHRVEESYLKARGKGNKDRIVPFSFKAQEVAREESLWTGESGISKRIARLSAKVGEEFSPHSLRRYRITQWANNPKIPIATTQKWAGHSSLLVTQQYVIIDDMESLKVAMYM